VSRTLLVVTYDAPHEESLSIVLAAPDWHMRDEATLAVPYATGTLRNLVMLPPDSLSFRFFADQLMRLTMYDRPRRSPPFAAFGFAVRRPFRWRRWFSLESA